MGATVNLYQVSNLFPKSKTIKKIAQHIIQNSLNKKEVNTIIKVLVKIVSNIIINSSYISRFWIVLQKLNILEKIIFAALDQKTTYIFNKIQIEHHK